MSHKPLNKLTYQIEGKGWQENNMQVVCTVMQSQLAYSLPEELVITQGGFNFGSLLRTVFDDKVALQGEVAWAPTSCWPHGQTVQRYWSASTYFGGGHGMHIMKDTPETDTVGDGVRLSLAVWLGVMVMVVVGLLLGLPAGWMVHKKALGRHRAVT